MIESRVFRQNFCRQSKGEATLQIHIREAKSYLWNVEINNYESPAVGGEQELIGVSHKNVTGYGDWLTAAFRRSRGQSSISTRYRIPINANDTSIEFGFEQTESKVIEKSFKQFDIKSRVRGYSLTLHYPVRQALNDQLNLFFSYKYRKSTSFLLGSRFSLSEGVEDGIAKISVLCFGQD